MPRPQVRGSAAGRVQVRALEPARGQSETPLEPGTSWELRVKAQSASAGGPNGEQWGLLDAGSAEGLAHYPGKGGARAAPRSPR